MLSLARVSPERVAAAAATNPNLTVQMPDQTWCENRFEKLIFQSVRSGVDAHFSRRAVVFQLLLLLLLPRQPWPQKKATATAFGRAVESGAI